MKNGNESSKIIPVINPRNSNFRSLYQGIYGLGVVLFVSVLLFSCQNRGSYMSKSQQQALQNSYDSLQKDYRELVSDYESENDTLPANLRSLYTQMQRMHRQMNQSHQQMMTRNMDRPMEGNKMMKQRMHMGMQMQNHMTGEWYNQMISMHRQMAEMHQRLGQQHMAEMNERLADEFQNMRGMVPGLNKPSDVPFNQQGNPDYLNGEQLFTENCSSCHGAEGEGISGTFPPLIDSQWVTGDKSVPIRIMLHGLSGEIKVQGETYQGIMPSFKARLSAAEITAILNYLRKENDDQLPEVTQEEVINIGKKYSQRSRPWTSSELNGQ